MPCGSCGGNSINAPVAHFDTGGAGMASITMWYRVRLADGAYYSDANGEHILFATAGEALTIIGELGGELEGVMVSS